jgi:hypothetical protein
MALEMRVTASLPGLSKEVPRAYLRINRISGCKRGLNFEVGYHESASSRFAFKTESFSFVPEAENRWDAQAYEYLKKQGIFSSAIDC